MKRITSLVLTVAAAAVIGAVPMLQPAQAQVYIGPGGPVFAPGLPPPPYGRPGYGPPPYAGPGYGGPGYEDFPGERISCRQGARIVAANGFRDISPRECSGRVYRYTAYRGPASFEVRVASSTGEITRIRRIN
jgi:hypothetical protein